MSHVTHTNESSQLLRLWRSFLWLFSIFLNFSVLSEMRAHYIVGRKFEKSLIVTGTNPIFTAEGFIGVGLI